MMELNQQYSYRHHHHGYSSSKLLPLLIVLLCLILISTTTTIQLSYCKLTTTTTTPTTTNSKINDLIHQLKLSNIKKHEEQSPSTTTTSHHQHQQYHRNQQHQHCNQNNNNNDEQTILFNVPPIGILKGLESFTNNYKSFKSIPYASAPVGDLRWKDPQPQPLPFKSILDVTQFGPMCPQNCLLPHGLCAQNQSEDCLTLNIYTPFNITINNNTNSNTGLKPVMVFFPGGHFDQGTANCPLYDGRYFVSKGDVILVTVNYRLGALGYLVSLSNNIKGNFALKDQRLALKFIKSYISYFGGDGNRITIFGESAGAGSITSLIQNKASEGLFQQAIFQSNPLSLPFRDLKSLDSLGNRFITDTKCSSSASTSTSTTLTSSSSVIECLKALPFNQVVASSDQSSNHLNVFHPILAFMPWTPCIDGIELIEQPLDAFKNGNYFKMPIMMGTCSEEAIMFVYLALSSPLNYIEYDASILALFGLSSYSKVHHLYPPSNSDQRVELSILGTDYIFTAPTRNALESIYNHQPNIPIFLFEFNHTLSFSEQVFKERYPFCVGHVCHGSELPLLFHSSQYVDLYLSEQEEILSQQMMQYWTNFAHTGNPNNKSSNKTSNKSSNKSSNDSSNKSNKKKSNDGEQIMVWNNFTPSNLLNMEFQTPKSFMVQGLRKEKLDMFDKIGYHNGY